MLVSGDPRRSRTIGRRTIAVAAVMLSIAVPIDVGATTNDQAAAQAAAEIQAARDRANAAAQAMFDAESELDTLSIDLAATEQELGAQQTLVDTLRVDLSAVAIRRFTGGGVENNPLLNGLDAATDDRTAAVFTGAATGSSLVDVDDYVAAIDALEAT